MKSVAIPFEDYWASLAYHHGYAGWVYGLDMWQAHRRGMADIAAGRCRTVTVAELRAMIERLQEERNVLG